MKRTVSVAIAIVALIAVASVAQPAHAQKKGLTVDDMLAMQRVSEPDVSPDGKWVAFTVRDTDFDANKGRTDIWLASVDGTTSPARRLTTHPDGDSSPSWSSDGKYIYFASSRSGSSQVWRIPAQGGEAEQVTKLPLDVNGFVLFPGDKSDNQRMVVAVDVFADIPAAKAFEITATRDEDQAKSKVKARAFDQLLFRHWDQWEDGKFSHLFVWSPATPNNAVDVTAGLNTDAPTHPFGGMEEVSVSPDGKTLAYVARVGVASPTSTKDLAWTTNTDVFVTSTDGKGKPTNITAASKAYDFSPSFSPDGKSIAWLAMLRPGYEADKQRVALYDLATKKSRMLTEATDRSFGEILWSNDGKTIFTSADNGGHHSLYSVDTATGAVRVVVEKGTNQSASIAGDRVLFSRDTLDMPVELFTVRADGGDLKQVTRLNAERLSKIAFGAYEQFTFKGAKGETVSGFAMKPANYSAGKVPLAFLIHGGPQGSFGDHWHYRWNPQAYAGHGYGVVFIDFHGSTGYGQAFTDAINGDWGGAPYEDLMLGLDAALAKFPWLDGTRAAALGASYGGYMINWVNGHTDRFKALVCHDGNIDERMAYFDTEELWFPEWEHGGGPPWEKPDGYVKHNPVDFIKNWKTPTLVIHGGNDFRVVDTQGMGTFTALQRKGVASRFLHFPDENHWVLKPQNSKRWHEEVLAWLDRYTKK